MMWTAHPRCCPSVLGNAFMSPCAHHCTQVAIMRRLAIRGFLATYPWVHAAVEGVKLGYQVGSNREGAQQNMGTYRCMARPPASDS